MADSPSLATIEAALADAAAAHHDYEAKFLGGERDEHWPGFYAAFVLGRLGDFASPTTLTEWIRDAPADAENWPASTAAFIVGNP